MNNINVLNSDSKCKTMRVKLNLAFGIYPSKTTFLILKKQGMKNLFMVEMFMPDEMTPEFMRMIPAHRAYISKLINDGTIQSYSINNERSNGWILFLSDESSDVEEILQQFPIYSFVRFQIHEIMVHDSESYRFPKMHMN